MIKVFFDGGCFPNPGGVVTYGAVIKRHEEIIYEISKKANISPDISTNNVAEYCAVIASMKYLLYIGAQKEEIYFFGDSKLVINQLSHKWEIGDGKYTPYAMQALMLATRFTDKYFEWIPRKENSYADQLARNASGLFR